MRSTLFIVVCAVVAIPAHAQIYKCTVDGKTVFMDRPCHIDAQPENVRPAAGGYDPDAAIEVEARTARHRAAVAEAEAERARVAAAQALQRASEPKQITRCEQLHQDYNRAMKLASEYRHPDNVARERANALHARDRSFWECSPDNRISAM